jgi:hypothetical protein
MGATLRTWLTSLRTAVGAPRATTPATLVRLEDLADHTADDGSSAEGDSSATMAEFCDYGSGSTRGVLAGDTAPPLRAWAATKQANAVAHRDLRATAGPQQEMKGKGKQQQGDNTDFQAIREAVDEANRRGDGKGGEHFKGKYSDDDEGYDDYMKGKGNRRPQEYGSDSSSMCAAVPAKGVSDYSWQCCPSNRQSTLSQLVGSWIDQKHSAHQVEMDAGRKSCSVTTTRQYGEVFRSPGLLKQDDTRHRIVLGSGFYLVAEGEVPAEIRWVSLSGRSRDFMWTRTASAASSQDLALATGGAICFNSDDYGLPEAWDDCSVELELESEAWEDCGEDFQDSLSFKKGDCILRLVREDEDDSWCWGELKGTSRQGWVPKGLFSMRPRMARQAAEDSIAASSWR